MVNIQNVYSSPWHGGKKSLEEGGVGGGERGCRRTKDQFVFTINCYAHLNPSTRKTKVNTDFFFAKQYTKK